VLGAIEALDVREREKGQIDGPHLTGRGSLERQGEGAAMIAIDDIRGPAGQQARNDDRGCRPRAGVPEMREVGLVGVDAFLQPPPIGRCPTRGEVGAVEGLAFGNTRRIPVAQGLCQREVRRVRRGDRRLAGLPEEELGRAPLELIKPEVADLGRRGEVSPRVADSPDEEAEVPFQSGEFHRPGSGDGVTVVSTTIGIRYADVARWPATPPIVPRRIGPRAAGRCRRQRDGALALGG
jgi:hypothetical protein